MSTVPCVAEDDEDTFDWNGVPEVVVPTQMALAVYTNANGDIVVRQEGDRYTGGDSWVVFSTCNAVAVTRRILQEAGFDPVSVFAPEHQPPQSAKATTAPKDKTAAERQRRYRARNANRNAVTPETVTPVTDDAVTPSLFAAE